MTCIPFGEISALESSCLVNLCCFDCFSPFFTQLNVSWASMKGRFLRCGIVICISFSTYAPVRHETLGLVLVDKKKDPDKRKP